jgi:hypothetical protein
MHGLFVRLPAKRQTSVSARKRHGFAAPNRAAKNDIAVRYAHSFAAKIASLCRKDLANIKYYQ